MHSAKRALTIVLAALLLFTAIGLGEGAAEAAGDTRYVRVCLSSYGNLSSATMKVNGVYSIKEAPNVPLNRGDTVAFSVSGSKLTLSVNGTQLSLGNTVTLKRCSSASATNWLTMTNPTGFNYPGDVTVSVKSASALQIVVRVFMEDYLMGVLPFEMSNSFPLEALKAQAVAARTYAVAAINPSAAYDVVDTSASQVFRGYNAAYTRCAQAITETAGQVLLWNGKISDGVYSASNGGQINPRCPRWGNTNTYHTLKNDPYDLANPSSPSYTFLFPRTLNSATSMDDRLENRVKRMLVDAASAVGVKTKAANITILGFDDVQLHSLPAPNANGSTDPASFEFQQAALTVRCSIGGIEYTLTGNVSTADLKAACSGDTGTLAYHRVFYREESEDGLYIRIIARGYGHGIGLSQRGAQYMANAGATVTEILHFYYNGCTLGNNGTAADTVSLPASSATLYSTATAVTLTKTPGGSEKAVNGSLGAGITVSGVLTSGKYLLVSEPSTGALGYTTVDKLRSSTSNPEDLPILGSGTVNVKSLNVREAASADSKQLGMVSRDYVLQIVEDGPWVKVLYGSGYGYVNASYLDITWLSVVPTPTATAAPTETLAPAYSLTGHVNATLLNVRNGAGTSFKTIGQLANGTAVTILETVNGWYKIEYNGGAGYVSATYIVLDTLATPTPAETPAPDTPVPALTPTPAPIWMGTVNASALNYRTGPGTNYPSKGTLPRGTVLTILEKGAWLKISHNGGTYYVNAGYVNVAENTTPTPMPATPTPVPTTPTPVPTAAPQLQGKVTATQLHYRTGPGTQYPSKGLLKKDTVVTVLEKGEWCKISYNGGTFYASGKYLQITALTPTPVPSENPMSGTGKGTVTADSLYVRSGPSTNDKALGTVRRNETVIILQEGSLWHTISYKGGRAYVSAKYITITVHVPTAAPTAAPTVIPTTAPVSSPEARYEGVVIATALNYRPEPNTGCKPVGTLKRNTRVPVEEVGSMWHRITYNGKSYYVSATYIRLEPVA